MARRYDSRRILRSRHGSHGRNGNSRAVVAAGSGVDAGVGASAGAGTGVGVVRPVQLILEHFTGPKGSGVWGHVQRGYWAGSFLPWPTQSQKSSVRMRPTLGATCDNWEEYRRVVFNVVE